MLSDTGSDGGGQHTRDDGTFIFNNNNDDDNNNNTNRKKRKGSPLIKELSDKEITTTGKILTQIIGINGDEKNDEETINNEIKERGKRFKKVASSKSARDLPENLDEFCGEEKSPNKIDSAENALTTEHMIGVLSSTGQNGLSNQMMGILMKEKKDVEELDTGLHNNNNNNTIITTKTKKKSRKRRTRKDTRNDEELKRQLTQKEREDYQNGLIKNTTDQIRKAHDVLSDNHVMETAQTERKNTLESLPRRTLNEYNARDGREMWMLQALNMIDKKELEIVRQQPGANMNSQFLMRIKKEVPFYDNMMRVHIESNKKVPIPELVDWDHAAEYYREPVLERGERPCVNGRSGACVVQRDFGFVAREFLKPTQSVKFNIQRIKDPDTCQEFLPKIQRMCLPCHQAVVSYQYHLRISKRNHEDPETEMETGRSALLDDNESLTDIQFDVHHEGQYNIWCCIGIGDTEYHGMAGPFIPWDKSNYIEEKTSIWGLTNENKRDEEKTRRLKAMHKRQRKTERFQQTGLSDDMYRDTDGKLHYRGTTSNTPVAIYSTAMGSPVPGEISTPQSEIDPLTGRKKQNQQRVIRRLRQRECLLFRKGVMPAKIESLKTSSRSIHTGLE